MFILSGESCKEFAFFVVVFVNWHEINRMINKSLNWDFD